MIARLIFAIIPAMGLGGEDDLWKRARVPAFLLILLFVFGGTLAIGAGAGNGTSSAKIGGTTDVSGLAVAEGTAKCPAKHSLLSGGMIYETGDDDGLVHRFGAPTDKTGDPFASDSGRTPKRFFASTSNEVPEDRPFRIFAVCAKADVELATRDFEIGGLVESKSVRCPAGRRAVGGGAFIEGGIITASGPTDETGTYLHTSSGDVPRRWFATVRNQLGEPAPARVFATCAKGSDAKLEVELLSLPGNPGGSSVASTTACPQKKRVIGGGLLHASGESTTYNISVMGPLDSSGVTTQTKVGDTAKGWLAGLSTPFSIGSNFKVIAICE